MTVNFEYISALPWAEGFEDVIGQAIPFSRLVEQLAPADGEIDCTPLTAGDPLLGLIRGVADQAMTDLGFGVMSLRRDPQGHWIRADAASDRRITGITGLSDPSQRLVSTGPAAAVFRAISASVTTMASVMASLAASQLRWWHHPLGHGAERRRKHPVAGAGGGVCRWQLCASIGMPLSLPRREAGWSGQCLRPGGKQIRLDGGG